MLAYTVIGSNNKQKALEFYDAIVGELGGARTFNNERLQFYSNGQGAMLGVGTPSNEEQATFGNGTMPAFACADTATVDRVYNKAIELGATCEGAPGERIPGMFYGAYFRDADGNKLCAAHFLNQGA
jgi:catechol 2,3-dioxygenase-like lactoylglutathione lyase family enzyme